MSAAPATVAAYLAALPPERRAVVAAVRKLIRAHLPAGYVEVFRFGMITYEIPLARYPDTYNGQPLQYVALAAQKHAYSLYLMAAYMAPARARALERAFAATGKRFDMGKSCLRFRSLDGLPLDAIAAEVAATPVEEYLAMYEASRRR